MTDHLAQILIASTWNTASHKEPKKVHWDFEETLRNKDIVSRHIQNANWDMDITPVKLRKYQYSVYQTKNLFKKLTT